jgi:hypothetical protein
MVKKRIEQHSMKSQIQDVLTTVRRIQVIVEEQRSKNRIILDGFKIMKESQDRIDGYILDIRTTLRTLKPVAIS